MRQSPSTIDPADKNDRRAVDEDEPKANLNGESQGEGRDHGRAESPLQAQEAQPCAHQQVEGGARKAARRGHLQRGTTPEELVRRAEQESEIRADGRRDTCIRQALARQGEVSGQISHAVAPRQDGAAQDGGRNTGQGTPELEEVDEHTREGVDPRRGNQEAVEGDGNLDRGRQPFLVRVPEDQASRRESKDAIRCQRHEPTCRRLHRGAPKGIVHDPIRRKSYGQDLQTVSLFLAVKGGSDNKELSHQACTSQRTWFLARDWGSQLRAGQGTK